METLKKYVEDNSEYLIDMKDFLIDSLDVDPEKGHEAIIQAGNKSQGHLIQLKTRKTEYLKEFERSDEKDQVKFNYWNNILIDEIEIDEFWILLELIDLPEYFLENMIADLQEKYEL